MHASSHPCLRNRLLSLLPQAEFDAVVADLSPVELPRGTIIAHAHEAIEHVYFLCSGIGSVVTVSTEGQRAEAGMFGREGFAPTSGGVGGAMSYHEVTMQIAGEGFRMPVEALMKLLPSKPSFSGLLSRFIQTFATQISYTALAGANFRVDQRLARWLLMCHDRLDTDEIPLTHSIISRMLAVRRPSVTNAIHILEGQKLVVAERSRITMRDRKGLEEFAGGAYGEAEEEYRTLIGAW